MPIKKIFYKFTNKKKYHKYKLDSSIENKIKIFKSKLEDKILKIQQIMKIFIRNLEQKKMINFTFYPQILNHFTEINGRVSTTFLKMVF